MSFKPEVEVDGPGKWFSNQLCFATREEAENNARDLMMRWMLVRDWRVVESTDPVNYSFINGELKDCSRRQALAESQSTSNPRNQL